MGRPGVLSVGSSRSDGAASSAPRPHRRHPWRSTLDGARVLVRLGLNRLRWIDRPTGPDPADRDDPTW